MPLTIEPASTRELLESAKELFREYSLTISAEVCIVDFAREVAGLPGQYGPPDGQLWVALHGHQLAGCVAVRRLEDGVCEMKRLFVRDTARGTGLGRRLVHVAIEWACQAGYREMRLDTLPKMEAAIALYQSMGFRNIPPYGAKPIPEALHFSLDIP
ncbi:MAG: GNAT family N-acetyltransferase [Bryobacteraceae bacterium]